MLENIRNSLENGEFDIGISHDFQKVFDTVDHDILSNKRYGIRGISLEWFKNCLSTPYQVVK